jgi:hypothetical protein
MTCIGLVFALVFGVIFIVAGLRRLFGGAKGSRLHEDIVWGSVGIVLGVGLIVVGVLGVWTIWTVDEKDLLLRRRTP